jgi:predicted Rossmann fold nucleotide-binding protein DprA/Smf involved in DNA uptake
MTIHHLTSDTQAILLLCAGFGKSRSSYPQPLSLKEYNSFAQWLREKQLRPADILESDGHSIISTCDFLEPQRLQSLVDRGMMLAISVEKWTSQGLWILGRGDQLYPSRLKQRLGANAPPLLYGVGDIELLSRGGLAVVGSRDVNEDGIAYTEEVASKSARQNIQIVSGGARGVDTVAMLAALAGGGTVIGVLADSLSKAAVSSKYRSAIQDKRLVLLSAVDPQAGFNVGSAMGRNKYIYALADFGLVVSADYNRGGTWSGAIEALKQEKSVPVFVRTENNTSQATQQLIKHGAREFPYQPWGNNLEQRLNDALAEELNRHLDLQCSLFSNEIISQEKLEKNKSKPEKNNKIDIISSPSSIYEAILPFVLSNLDQPSDAKSLSKKLDVNLTQLQYWLKKAIEDGRITKTHKPVKYVLK